ncbi:Chemotaxis protein CheA [Myxococcaceae bacterium]|nr:Chemotaxis protein CheA [Myxococcaceae bacterium]
MDPARYRDLFVEEAGEHLGDLGRALLALEKDPASADALETCFRMVHSVKGMAAAMHFDPITAVAHRLEDRLDAARRAGKVDPTTLLPKLFEGLDVLERLLGAVRETGACPEETPPRKVAGADARLKKKLPRSPSISI